MYSSIVTYTIDYVNHSYHTFFAFFLFLFLLQFRLEKLVPISNVLFIHNITPMKIWANMSKELHVPVEWSWYIMYIYTTLNPAKFAYPTKYIYKKSIPLISCSLKWLVPDQSIFRTSFNLLTCENAMVQLPLYFTLITPWTYILAVYGVITYITSSMETISERQ